MQKRDYVLLAVVATMLASPSLFIILPDVNETIIATIVTIVEGGMLLILKQYFFGNEIPYNEKKDHTKKICEIYRLLTRVEITQGGCDTSSWNDFQKSPTEYKHCLIFPTEYKPLAGQIVEELLEGVQIEQIYEEQLKNHPIYLYYYRALEHLKKHKKYSHIYKYWENTKNLLDELNGKTSIEERLEDVIKEKMHHDFPALQSSTSMAETSNHYNPDNIVQFMMEYFKDQNFSKHALNSLVCVKSAENKFVYSKLSDSNFHIIMKSDSKMDFETYKKLVKEMTEDGSLKDFYNEYKDEYSIVIKELNDFKNELEKLVQNLRTGKLIEGKCDVGF